MALNYDATEKRALVAELRRMRSEGRLEGGAAPECPRCGESMTLRTVPPREEVAYVRDRIWVTCPACRRNAVVDRRDLEP